MGLPSLVLGFRHPPRLAQGRDAKDATQERFDVESVWREKALAAMKGLAEKVGGVVGYLETGLWLRR
jgi:hypothetical protein